MFLQVLGMTHFLYEGVLLRVQILAFSLFLGTVRSALGALLLSGCKEESQHEGYLFGAPYYTARTEDGI